MPNKQLKGLFDKKHRHTCNTINRDGNNNVVYNNATVDKYNKCYFNMGPDLAYIRQEL